MRSPVFEGIKMTESSARPLSWGPGMCVQTTEWFIKRVPGPASGLFWFTRRRSAWCDPWLYMRLTHMGGLWFLTERLGVVGGEQEEAPPSIWSYISSTTWSDYCSPLWALSQFNGYNKRMVVISKKQLLGSLFFFMLFECVLNVLSVTEGFVLAQDITVFTARWKVIPSSQHMHLPSMHRCVQACRCLVN